MAAGLTCVTQTLSGAFRGRVGVNAGSLCASLAAHAPSNGAHVRSTAAESQRGPREYGRWNRWLVIQKRPCSAATTSLGTLMKVVETWQTERQDDSAVGLSEMEQA